MATLNAESNKIVIRLVYDGLALSGKTTTLRMLASSLDQDFYTPEERYGRTVFFDWVGYTGGLFEGYQIRCQIVSVPGQELWADRRQQLLDTADVVVFVGDTTRGRFADSLASLRAVHRQIEQRGEPPVGIIFQANKRDLGDTVPLDEIHRELAGTMRDIAIVESVASEGSGVRQAFVFAVRLCLDRVRELLRTNSLPVGVPAVDSGEALLAEIQALEKRTTSRLAPSESQVDAATNAAEVDRPGLFVTEALNEVFRSENHMAASKNGGNGGVDGATAEIEAATEVSPVSPGDYALSPPLLPQVDVPSGMIWPPVEGRITLREAISASPKILRTDNGDWTASGSEQWRFYSYKQDVFDDLPSARQALINWAHRHISISAIMSPLRCLVLAETGHGNWRLWQVIKVEGSLLVLSREALESTDLQLIADGIWGTAYMYLTAADHFQAHRYQFPCTLETIAFFDGNIRYNGLIPSPSLPWPKGNGHNRAEDSEVVLRAHIREIIPRNIPNVGNQLESVIGSIARRGDGSGRSKQALEITRDLLGEVAGG
ncbi:MAG TPA: GTPase domain-containing protein [Blastocatellia bacterium]